MRKAKTYYPVYLGLRISTELNEALWKAADLSGVDRSRWVRNALDKAVKKALEKELPS